MSTLTRGGHSKCRSLRTKLHRPVSLSNDIRFHCPGASAQVVSANEASETELPEHVESQLDDTSEDAYAFYAPEVDETSTEQSWAQISPEAPDNGDQEVEPQQILNPIDVNNCIMGISTSGLTLQNYASTHNGMVALQCGTLASGLRHIADEHSTN